MAIKLINAVYAICDFSDWSVSNLKLQKILYLAHKQHLGENNKNTPLVNSFFQAWKYGPVIPLVYRELRQYQDRIIEQGSWVFNVRERNYDKPEYATIRKTVNKYFPLPASQLIEITHIEGGAWSKHYKEGEHEVIIPNEAIYQEHIDFPAYNA